MSPYRALIARGPGGPEALELIDVPLVDPGRGEIRVRVRAAGVGATDLAVMRGNYPFAPRLPLVPGYEVAGVVDAVGPNVTEFRVGDRVAGLTIHGGFADFITHRALEFFPIPDELSFIDAAASVLNFGTAWQAIERTAHATSGKTALVTAAAGGVGSALVQLLRFKGISVIGAASAGKHDFVRDLGALPIDSRLDRLSRGAMLASPSGVDFAFDALGGVSISRCIDSTRVGGLVVGYGFASGESIATTVGTFARLFFEAPLRGRRGAFYGITLEFRKDPKRLREDIPKIFALLASRVLKPAIAETLPLIEAASALRKLQQAQVAGKIVLVNG